MNQRMVQFLQLPLNCTPGTVYMIYMNLKPEQAAKKETKTVASPYTANIRFTTPGVSAFRSLRGHHSLSQHPPSPSISISVTLHFAAQAQFWRALLAGRVPGSPEVPAEGHWLQLPPTPSGATARSMMWRGDRCDRFGGC